MDNIFSLFNTDDSDFGDKLQQIDVAIDLFSSIKKPSTSSEHNKLVKQTIKDAIDLGNKNKNNKNKSNEENSFENIFKETSIPRERINRYKAYDEISNSVQMIKNIIDVYVNNICLSNPIDNKILFPKKSEDGNNNNERYNYYENVFKKINNFFKFEEKLKTKIIPHMLKYGDFFVEVINLDEEHIEFPEGEKPKNLDKNNDDDYFFKKKVDKLFQESLNYISKNKLKNMTESHLDCILDKFITFDEKTKTKESILYENEMILKQKNNSNTISKIVLKFHKPHNIIPIFTPYDNIIGYIEIESYENKIDSEKSYNPFGAISNVLNKVNIITNSANTKNELIKKFSKAVTEKIFKKYSIYKTEKDNDAYNEKIKSSLEPEIFYSLKRLLYSSKDESEYFNKLNIKYISPENMFHYKSNVNEYYPLGTSVVDSLIYPGRLYLLTQIANVITKYSRSAPIRKWNLETGSITNISAELQKLNSQFNNNKITMKDIVSTNEEKDLPNLISAFHDLIVVKKNGTPFFDVEMLQTGDPTIGIRDLEDLRNEIIALSGVPSSMLGYVENMDLRENLVQTNIAFATKISSLQQGINEQNTSLFSKISDMINPENNDSMSDYLNVSLMPPTSLMLQMVEMSISSLGNISGVMMNLQDSELKPNPLYIAEKFIPFINWKDYINSSKERDLVKTVTNPAQPNGGEGDMGMGGM